MPIPEAEDELASDEAGDGGLQLASVFGDRLRGQLKQHPEMEQNVRGTLAGLVGSGFTPQEINTLENRAFDAASPVDALTLRGLQSGEPAVAAPVALAKHADRLDAEAKAGQGTP